MAKYRQIGRVVEAVQYTGTDESRQACLELAGISLDHGSWSLAGDTLRIYIEQVLTIMLAMNSWLIKDSNGFRYVQDDKQFQQNHIKKE